MEINDFLRFFQNIEKKSQSIMDNFKKINSRPLLTKDNPLYNQIYVETIKVSSFLEESIINFHLLFDKNLVNFEDSLKYIESISIPNNCICAGAIDKISGWRCVECSKYENAIYCNDCYLKSKNFHKNHTVHYLYSSTGMCDCGDPNALFYSKIYCNF